MRFLFLLLLVSSVGFAQQLVFGIVPQQSPTVLFKKWNKVIQYLSKETGLDIKFKTELSISKFEQELYRGKYDLAYMNPYHFVVAHKRQDYQAKIRANKRIRGILVSKEKDLEITFDTLKDKMFLFPAPNAFAATLLPKMEMMQQLNFNIEENAQFQYVNSHDSVYKGVARDIGFIGGGIERTFNNFNSRKDKNKLHIVYKTNAYPSHPVAFHPMVPKEVVKKLEKAFFNMPDEIKKTLSIKQFITTNNKEYDVIKSLGL